VSVRVPWLTLGVFAVTSVVTGAMLIWPQIGAALQRDPAMLHGAALLAGLAVGGARLAGGRGRA
jgi:hypothetical protein